MRGWSGNGKGGRLEGEHLETGRCGAHDRASGAGLSDGGPRGPEALRLLRGTGVGRHERLDGDARHAPGTPVGVYGGAFLVWGGGGFPPPAPPTPPGPPGPW